MNKFWIVCKREYLQIVKKKSFILGILLTPALMAALMVLPAWLATKESSTADHLTIVDQSQTGLGARFAERLKSYTLPDSEMPAFNVELVDQSELFVGDSEEIVDSLRDAIDDKREKYALIIKPEPLASEENMYLITNADDMVTIKRFEQSMTDVYSSMRAEAANLGVSVDSIMALTEWVDIPLKDTRGEAIPFIIKFMTAFVFVMMIYMLIMMNGQILMRSIIEEKTSRIMEVLISSVSPYQLMLGKVLGFGAAALTQVGAWVLMGGVMFLYTGAATSGFEASLARIVFNPIIVIFFVLLFISGYILYSTLFALIGSIVNSDKESQGFMIPIAMMLMIPVIMGSSIAREPNAMWATVLSFVPFFAPTLMMMRVTFIAPTLVNPSLFSGIVMEASISFLITVLTTLVVIWLAAKVFRIGILMTGKRPTLMEIIKWIRY